MMLVTITKIIMMKMITMMMIVMMMMLKLVMMMIKMMTTTTTKMMIYSDYKLTFFWLTKMMIGGSRWSLSISSSFFLNINKCFISSL